MFYAIMLNLHSILRWVILALIIIAIVKSLIGWIKKYEYTALDDKFALFSLIFAHTQLIIGAILYFISPIVRSGLEDMAAAMKNSELRFWAVEHLTGMIVAVALITIGRVASKRKTSSKAKHRTVFIYFALGLLFMMAMIPWDRF